MHLRFSLDAADCRRWLLDLAGHLRAAGHEASFEVRPGGEALPAGVESLLWVESKLFLSGEPLPFRPLPPNALPQASGPAQVTLELSAAQSSGLSLRVAGSLGIGALPAALMARAPLALSLHDAQGALVGQAVPAVFDPDIMTRGISLVTARLATLILRVLAECPPLPDALPVEPRREPDALGFFLTSLGRKLRARLLPGHHRADHWRIGVRRRRVRDELPTPTLSGFSWLADDGTQYYADPALVERGTRTYLFMERFGYERRCGEIAVVELDDKGAPLGTPRVVLKRQGHLSFPILFEHAGETYLIAENSAEGHVPLYRARDFPDTWEELPPLLDQALHDPVMFRQGKSYWLLGTLELQGGSSGDALVAFEAPSPLGPFSPHPANPLLLDARFARSGGSVLMVAGQPMRVMQDCCTSYGSFLRLGRVESLDATGIRLGPMTEWLPPPGKGITGMHSYVRSRCFEAVDILTPRHWRPN